MGKNKMKPSQAGRGGAHYGKTNKRSFSLVFICNTIDEEKVLEALSYDPKTKCSRSTKKSHRRGFVPLSMEKEEYQPPPVAEPANDADSSSEEDYDDEDFDGNVECDESEEVYLDQIQKELASREEAHDLGGDIINILGRLEEPRDIDHLLNIVCHIFGFTFEKQKIIEPNEYSTRFNVNFNLSSNFSFLKFDALLTVLYKLFSYEKFKKYSIEVPFDVIHRQKVNLEANTRQKDLQNFTKFWVPNFYFGSQVNLNKFYCHFKLPINKEMAQIPMIMQMHFLKKYLILYFMLDTRYRMHKVYYSFASFKTIIMEKHQNYTRVYIDCIQAPIMNYVDLNDNQLRNLKEIDICDISGIERRWVRTVKFGYTEASAFRSGRDGFESRPTMPTQDENLLGMARTFCFEVPNENPILPVLIKMAFLCRERIKSFQFFLSSVEQIHSWPKLLYSQFKKMAHERKFRFSIYFALLVLFSDSYKLLDSFAAENSVRLLLDVIDDFTEYIPHEKSKETYARLEQCIYQLKTQCRECIIIHPYLEFLKIFKNLNLIPIEEEREDYVTIRRATMYPSHLELHQPVSLLRSRFSDLADVEYGLRITFADDNGGVLNKCKDEREKNFILDIMKPQLRDGIQLGDRLYEMLGSSTSQMRDCGCTMYARDKRGRRAEDVRNSAGQLGTFKSPSKYIARFGLVFSQSMTIIPLDESVNIHYTRDLEGGIKASTKDYKNTECERYILSDGIGMVDERVAKSWLPYLQVKNNYIPSAFQIRMGGCKGMLTAYPIPPKGANSKETNSIYIRASMKKYESDSRSIGILKYSSPRPVYLNRPLINILDHMKVDRDELYRYYHTSTASVVKATLYDSCAMDLIHTYSSGLLPYEKVLNSGISLLDEPFLRSIINYLIYYRLNFELKLKARIRVPNDCGRIAFGVLDEYQVLNPGEVYFQYTKLRPDGSMVVDETVVLDCEVMVTKFPCLQPGDVRKFKAVAHPRLKHIKDCLVFPAKGNRSHCDEMSGSDLDGDEYAIFFEPPIYFPGPNRKPMDFPYGLNSNQNNGITVDDMVEFFLKYLMMNNIGVVANTHLMYSDFLPDGLDDPDCENLAYLYNVSLDFPKTGVIMAMPRRDCTLAIRPDFMERNNYDQVYLSKKMLGEYFRHCSLLERTIELSRYDYRFTSFTPIKEKKGKGSDPQLPSKAETFQEKINNSFIKNKLILPEWKRFYKQANDALAEYRIKIIDLMEQLEVENEVMLFADVYEEKKDVSKVLLDGLFAHFQKKFTKQCEALKCTYTIDRLYLASAWYAICYDRKFTYNGRPILGLPWLISNEICQLAQYSFSGKVATEAALAQQKRRVVTSEGEVFEVQTGINHKQVVPYSLQNALICGMLFDYQTINVYGTDVIHHYWCPWKLMDIFRNYGYKHFIPIIYFYLEELQFKLVMRLLMKFFDTLRRRVYGQGNEKAILQYPDETDPETGEAKKTSEGWIIYNAMKKRLEEVVISCGRKTNDGIESLPTISTLFNRVLYYLFDSCNRVNSAVYHANLEELCLAKYAVFALSFIDKINTKNDRAFFLDFHIKFEQRWQYHIDLYNSIYKRQMEGINLSSPHFSKPIVSGYEISLNELFDSYLLDNNYLTEESISFFLPPMDNRVELLAEQGVLIPKLKYLSGVTEIEFNVTSTNSWGHMEEEVSLPDEGEDADPYSADFKPKLSDPIEELRKQRIPGTTPMFENGHRSLIGKLSRKSDVLKTVPYEVKTTGLVHSTQLLRLLIGHPSFFTEIYPKFNLSYTTPDNN